MSIRSLFLFLTGLLLLLLLAACSPNPLPPGLTPLPTLGPAGQVTLVPAVRAPTACAIVVGSADAAASSAALGSAVYMRNCTPCHGVQGEGVDAPPLRNSEYIQSAPEQDILTTISDGRVGTEMPAWLETSGGPLTSAEVLSALDYLRTLQGVAHVPPQPMPAPEPTEPPPEPGAPTPEPARPSEPGGPGSAATLAGDVPTGRVAFGRYCSPCHGPEGRQGIPNPGSDDGVVPELNPLDPTIVNPDPRVFAANVDLFVQHGSMPEGPGPRLMMPSFGDSQMLSQQDLADLIAYVMDLNGVAQAAARPRPPGPAAGVVETADSGHSILDPCSSVFIRVLYTRMNADSRHSILDPCSPVFIRVLYTRMNADSRHSILDPCSSVFIRVPYSRRFVAQLRRAVA